MIRKIIPAVMAMALAVSMTSCLEDSGVEDYEDWRLQNDAYIAAIDTEEYEVITPEWAPLNSIYMKWHNDRALTADNMVPLSNSTVDIKYELEDIEGTSLDNSYSVSTGDSVYQSKPNANVIGMMIAMLNMHVGDSTTVIIPYPSGYGSSATGSVKPYSNLIFHMKMKAIQAYEKPNS